MVIVAISALPDVLGFVVGLFILRFWLAKRIDDYKSVGRAFTI